VKCHLIAILLFPCPSGGKLSVQIQGYLHWCKQKSEIVSAYKYNLVAAKINRGERRSAPYRGSLAHNVMQSLPDGSQFFFFRLLLLFSLSSSLRHCFYSRCCHIIHVSHKFFINNKKASTHTQTAALWQSFPERQLIILRSRRATVGSLMASHRSLFTISRERIFNVHDGGRL
jgi:hypothetical protein